MDKIINSRCICKKGLPWIMTKVIMFEPCEHLFHKKCVRDMALCPICNIRVDKVRTITDTINNNRDKQRFVDILSMTNTVDSYKIDPLDVIDNVIDLGSILLQIPFARGMKQGLEICKKILSMNNVDIIVRGEDKILKTPKVFISNHTCYPDFIVLFYVLKSGFLSSSVLGETWIGEKLSKIVPLLMIQRGKDVNTVDKMREYIKEKGSICLFPEGMITNQETIIKFRTGAFHTGYPVQPIVIRYDPLPSDISVTKFVLRWSSCKKMTITVDILDPIYPPFDEEKIEYTRKKMAEVGNMHLSRVSNKDLKDS